MKNYTRTLTLLLFISVLVGQVDTLTTISAKVHNYGTGGNPYYQWHCLDEDSAWHPLVDYAYDTGTWEVDATIDSEICDSQDDTYQLRFRYWRSNSTGPYIYGFSFNGEFDDGNWSTYKTHGVPEGGPSDEGYMWDNNPDTYASMRHNPYASPLYVTINYTNSFTPTVQTTYVPDDNFEQALIDLGYDDVLDNYVVTDSISSVTYLNVSNESISDLTGIQSFTALTTLYCHDNQLDTLDVSNNTALTYLGCYRNQLTALDVSNNTALTTLYCYGSSSTSSYGVTNQITALDVSNNTLLTTLSCHDNQLDSLDVSNNTLLTYLSCHYNQLTALDVSNNTALTSLYCYGSSSTSSYGVTNQITALDVSNNTALTSLSCSYNQLTALDVSNNTALTYLNCGYQPLTELDVSNNTALTSLYCHSNELTVLDVSNNTSLNNLGAANNDFTAFDVSLNTALTSLQLQGNDLTALDVSNNTALTSLYVHSNDLTAFDVSNNTALTILYVGSNDLTAFDVSNNTALTFLYVSYMDLTAFDVSNNTALTRLYVSSNDLTILDVSVNTALEYINCSNNELESLDVSSNTALETLYCQSNQLTYLNMKNGVTDQLTTFNATSNDSLECIETLDPDYATTNWTYENGNIDEGVTFAIACGNFNLHVATTGSDSTGDGSYENPFATIQHAVNSASDNDTVTVHPGTYEFEATTIDKDLHVLSTDGPDQTILNGTVYISNASMAAFEGFTVADAFRGLMVQDSSYAVIRNNYFLNIDQEAVWVFNYASADLEFNLVDDARFGVSVGTHAGAYINYNTITNCSETGIVVQDTSTAEIANTIIWDIAGNSIHDWTNNPPNSVYVHYSNVQGGWTGEGEHNIDRNPLFCSPDNGDFSLSENSPCLIDSWGDADYMGVFGVGCGTLDIEFPSIGNIWDVPDDQGNWVYIQFNPSVHDASDEGPLGSYTIERLDDEEWVSLHSIDAYGAEHYTTEAHTLMDSTGEDDGMTSYRIVAAMEVGALISAPAAGYSIDNIAPGVPTGLMATVSETGIHLSWDLSTAEDFQYFDLEKSSTADFGEYQVIETADTVYLDADYEVNVTVYYRLVAYDDGGNASEHSVAIDITVLWADLGIAIPDEFAIHQNYPNPFNPVTTLRYDLPEQGHVRITIYDMLGRDVKTLINEYQDPGYRSIIWDATNDYGKPVSAGMYLYQIQANNFLKTKKMILVK